MDYTPQELMVVCAARQIQDGEHVFVGMRLPLLAFALAKRTHAPRCVGLFEAGILRDTPAAELLYTMGDAPNITGALWATHTITLMGLMAARECAATRTSRAASINFSVSNVKPSLTTSRPRPSRSAKKPS